MPVLPPALILRRDCNDLFTLRDKPQQVVPRKVLWDCITDQISDFALTRLLIALRHLLVTAPLVIVRIEAGPRVGLIEILRIGAADCEIDFVDVPVVRIVESEDYVIIDLAPLLWRLLFRAQSPLPGLIENLRTAIRDLNLPPRFPPETPNIESRFIRIDYLVRRAGQFEKCVQAIFDRVYCSVEMRISPSPISILMARERSSAINETRLIAGVIIPRSTVKRLKFSLGNTAE